MREPIRTRNEKAGKKLVENLQKKAFEAYYCETCEEACEKALSLIKKTDVITWGGCHSAEEIGLIDALREGGYNILDRATAKDAAEKKEIYIKAFTADVYLGGANGVSEQGDIINIDGNGNRVAAMTWGPESVIVVIGMNKVMPDLDSAMKRARSVASPINCQRFGLNTPCSVTGMCADCNSPDSICNYFQIIRRSKPAGRIKVIVCGEDLGY